MASLRPILQAVANVLERFPDLRLVIAHMGMPEYDAFADLVEAYDHVHLDTTMFASGYFSSPAEVGPAYRARLARLEDRIILGSDFPNIPYPYATQVEALVRLDLGDDWLRGVLWHNGARLLCSDNLVAWGNSWWSRNGPVAALSQLSSDSNNYLTKYRKCR